MPEVLTHRQREILDYLRKMLREKAYPPTVREIGLAIGLSSSSTVQNHLNTLERKGYIRRDPAKSRAIEMVEKRTDRRGEPRRARSPPPGGPPRPAHPTPAPADNQGR